MTLKNVKLMAESMKALIESPYYSKNDRARQALRESVDNIATVLKLDNPRFDRNEFLKDCGF